MTGNAVRIKRAMRLLAVAVMCLGIIAPVHAAEKVTEKTPMAATAAPGDAAPVKLGPGEALANAIRTRGMPSDKDNMAVLMPLTGTWDYEESFWTDPKAEPQRSMGTVTSEMVLDNRFLSAKSAGSLNVGGQLIPTEGQELIGYDTVKKSFSFAAADTVTTGMMLSTGKYDEKKHVVAQAGRFTNPLTGLNQDFRSELLFVDAEHYKRTVFAADKAGRETKLIEIDYSRRQ